MKSGGRRNYKEMKALYREIRSLHDKTLLTFREIGRVIGVSAPYAVQVYNRFKKAA